MEEIVSSLSAIALQTLGIILWITRGTRILTKEVHIQVGLNQIQQEIALRGESRHFEWVGDDVVARVF